MNIALSRWRYAFSVLALLLLFVLIGASKIADVLSRANPVLVSTYVVGLGATSLLYATQVWMAFQFAQFPVGWRLAARASIRSWSVGLITPARAGDLTLSYFIGDAVPSGTSVAVVATEKLLSLAWLAVVALVVSLGLALDTAAVGIASGAVLAVVLGVALIARTNVLGWMAGRWGSLGLQRFVAVATGSMHVMLRQPRFVAATAAAITIRWMIVFALNLVLFHAVDYQPGLVFVIAATSIGRLLALVPISVSGLGVKEPIQIAIYSLTDVPASAVVAVSVLGAASNYLVASILTLVMGTRAEARSE